MSLTTEFLEFCTPLVARWEGCAKKIGDMIHPYLDRLAKPPVWTRGYGRTYGITAESPAITIEEAKKELGVGLLAYAKKVLMYSPGLANKPQILAAVTSWSWNCGVGAYKASRLRRALNAERYGDALEYIKKPNTAGGVVYRGLTNRRLAERRLLLSGILSL